MKFLLQLLCFFIASSATVLAVNRYVEAGFPDPERKWTVADYQTAAAALKSRKLPLPTFADPDGAVVLKQLLNAENLSFLSDKSIAVASRSEAAAEMETFIHETLWPEYKGVLDQKNMLSELAHIQAFMLRNRVAFYLVMRESLLEGIEKSDMKADLKAVAASAMESTLQSNLYGRVLTAYDNTIKMLGISQMLNDADRTGLILSMQDTLPQVVRHIPPQERARLGKQIKKSLTAATPQQDRERLNHCLVLLEHKK